MINVGLETSRLDLKALWLLAVSLMDRDCLCRGNVSKFLRVFDRLGQSVWIVLLRLQRWESLRTHTILARKEAIDRVIVESLFRMVVIVIVRLSFEVEHSSVKDLRVIRVHWDRLRTVNWPVPFKRVSRAHGDPGHWHVRQMRLRELESLVAILSAVFIMTIVNSSLVISHESVVLSHSRLSMLKSLIDTVFVVSAVAMLAFFLIFGAAMLVSARFFLISLFRLMTLLPVLSVSPSFQISFDIPLLLSPLFLTLRGAWLRFFFLGLRLDFFFFGNPLGDQIKLPLDLVGILVLLSVVEVTLTLRREIHRATILVVAGVIVITGVIFVVLIVIVLVEFAVRVCLFLFAVLVTILALVKFTPSLL